MEPCIQYAKTSDGVNIAAPDAAYFDDPWELLAETTGRGSAGAGAAVVGTPDELVATIRELQAVTGGFGTIVGFAHDWANREATLRSWELFARYVAPELNGITGAQKGSAQFVHEHKTELVAGATAAIMSKIQADEKAAAAFAVTLKGMQERTGTGFRPGFTETPDTAAKAEVEPADTAGS